MTQPTQPSFDRSTEDIGNLVEFGHVNVRVPDQQKAIIFYVMGLGLTRDPYLRTGIDNAWINVGNCQFHLPLGPAQVLRGTTHLVMPDQPALLERLAQVSSLLAGTRFGFEPGPAGVDVVCPWGNRICVHQPDARKFGKMALGMPRIDIDVGVGTAAQIARFYREMFASPALVGSDGEGVFAHVPIGLGESLRFRETQTPLPDYDGHHVQVAVADFSGVHRRLIERGLITEESDQSQYRFQDIVDIDGGAVLATIEHEVRSMRHPMYARRLVNRDPANSRLAYVSGHDDAFLQMAQRAR